LGVCSIYENSEITITCPVRFRQHWLIAEHAASFFFPNGTQWTSLTEVRLHDTDGVSAGNIDVVLVAYNGQGKIVDFGALEVQAVYISGNVRKPFEHYMKDPKNGSQMNWKGQPNYPGPDYLSSSRKRLAPQLLFKGGILQSWGKKQAVAIDQSFYNTLPGFPEVEVAKADIAWFIYEVAQEKGVEPNQLRPVKTVYTQFTSALTKITKANPGPVESFLEHLQMKLDEKLESNPPDAPLITDISST
jgi:hypothetical protein